MRAIPQLADGVARPTTSLGSEVKTAMKCTWPCYMYKTAKEIAYEDRCTNNSDGEEDDVVEDECQSCGSGGYSD